MGDGWVGGWMDGWMGGWMDGWVDGWMGGWVDGWIDGWMGDGWMYGWMWTGMISLASMHCCGRGDQRVEAEPTAAGDLVLPGGRG